MDLICTVIIHTLAFLSRNDTEHQSYQFKLLIQARRYLTQVNTPDDQ